MSILQKKIRSVDEEFTILFGCNGETPKNRLGESFLNSFALLRVVADGTKAQVDLGQ